MIDEDEEEVSYLPETQIQQYIRDIETNETQLLGATLKEIYEKNVSLLPFNLNLLNVFFKLFDLFKIKLETRVETYDDQIESICHHHYSKLSGAIQELRRRVAKIVI